MQLLNQRTDKRQQKLTIWSNEVMTTLGVAICHISGIDCERLSRITWVSLSLMPPSSVPQNSFLSTEPPSNLTELPTLCDQKSMRYRRPLMEQKKIPRHFVISAIEEMSSWYEDESERIYAREDLYNSAIILTPMSAEYVSSGRLLSFLLPSYYLAYKAQDSGWETSEIINPTIVIYSTSSHQRYHLHWSHNTLMIN